MNDRELIDLVQSTLPQDLTDQQIQTLRLRMRESAELREVLLDELRLEQGRAIRLVPESSSEEDFVEQIEKMVASRSRTRWLWVGAVSLLLIASVVPMISLPK